MSTNSNGLYTSKIINAGALLADTKTLLAHWDETQTVAENLRCAQQENIFGKASRAWVKQFLGIFQRRYLADETTTKALVTLVKEGLPAASLDRLLYFHAAQADRLLHDTVTEVLLPLQMQGRLEIAVSDIQRVLNEWVTLGKTAAVWSEATTLRVTQGLMSTLRDFGILQGAVNKRLAPVYLPIEAFAYIALYLRQGQPSGERLINHPEWRLFFLSPPAVERFFVEAHQYHLLEYHAAGSIIRISFPTDSLEEYAHVVLQRPA